MDDYNSLLSLEMCCRNDKIDAILQAQNSTAIVDLQRICCYLLHCFSTRVVGRLLAFEK